MDVWIVYFCPHSSCLGNTLIGVFTTHELATKAIVHFQKTNHFSDIWDDRPSKYNDIDHYYSDKGCYTIQGVNLDVFLA